VTDPDSNLVISAHAVLCIGTTLKNLRELQDQKKKPYVLEVKSESNKVVAHIHCDLHWVHSRTKLFEETLRNLKSEQTDVNEYYEESKLTLNEIHKPFPDLAAFSAKVADSKNNRLSTRNRGSWLDRKLKSKCCPLRSSS
jgi:hypothetical protein